jgi:hypothetical protein
LSVKTAGVGHFQIPTAPAAGTSVTSGAANVYTTNAVQLIASTAAALYITGIYAEEAAVSAATYKSVQLMIGAGGSETVIGQYLISPSTGSTVTRTYRPIFPPIPVANATRIAVKTADSAGSLATLISIECIAQSNVVDDGIAVGTVTTVTNQLTAAAIATGVWQDATAGDFTAASSIGKCLFISNIAPGAAGGHFIAGSNAGTTTLGALTVTGATTLTGNVALADGLTISAPSTGNRAGLDIAGNGTGAALKLVAGATGVGLSVAGGGTSGDGIKVTTTSGHGVNLAPVGTSMHGLLSTGGNAGTSDGIKAAAGTGGVDLRANQTGNVTGNVSGSVGSVTGAVGSVTGAVGSVTGLTASNLDATVSSRLASASYTAPLSAGATANAVWDELIATHAGAGSTGLSLATAAALGAPLTAAGTRAALGMASANLDTQIGALATSAQAVAIKAKTDSLTFTVAAKLDVNVLVVNGLTVAGAGVAGNAWRPA